MVKPPHGFRTSQYDRRSNEGYYTEHWVTKCLLPFIPDDVRNIIDPAAGRGDILKVLADAGKRTHGYDIDLGPSERANIPGTGFITQKNFFDAKVSGTKTSGCQGLVMNPPYGGDQVLYAGRKRTVADAFLRHALNQNVRFVAALLRTDFNHSSRRTDLFSSVHLPPTDFPFAFEIVLTKRPVWDWWIEDKPIIIDPKTGKEKKKSPMHNFSWFCFDREWVGPSTQYWMGPKDVDMSVDCDTDSENDGEEL
jgi:hypothetical protein